MFWGAGRSQKGALPAIHPAGLALISHFITFRWVDNGQTHDSQAPWPNNQPPEGPLPTATRVTILQLAHVCALVGLINLFVLRAARQHLASQPALQETLVNALLTPLLFGDVIHVVLTLWALDPSERWAVTSWSPLLSLTVFAGLSLLVPRMMWHAGIGRYVHSRDAVEDNSKAKKQ